VNVAIYGAGGHHWAMTERGRRDLSRGPDAFQLGPSRLSWRGDMLAIDLDEETTPFRQPVRGRITLRATRGGGPALALDGARRHHWRPIAPDCEAEVALQGPEQRWRGHGYLDTNWGDRPIAEDFASWDWSRSCGPEPQAFYELQARDGTHTAFSTRYDAAGVFGVGDAVAHANAGRSFWRIPRRAPGDAIEVIGTLEDTPFYARSLLRSRIGSQETALIHERLDCKRLSSPWVQALLPFRMPRVD
jgi:carotenoid 1,2-hydratase